MARADFEVQFYGEHGGHLWTTVIRNAVNARSAAKQAYRKDIGYCDIGTLRTLAYCGEFERWHHWKAHGTKRIVSIQARPIGPAPQP